MGPRIDVSVVISWDTGKEIVLKGLMQILQSQLKCPHGCVRANSLQLCWLFAALLPGKSHGWRSLVGCNPWGRKKLDMTEWLHFHFSLSCIGEGNGNPLQCAYLENPRDGGAWWAADYGVAQSRTWLKRLSSGSSRTVAHRAPLSMGFSRQEYWSGLLCPSAGDLLDPRIKPTSLTSPALAGGFFTTSTTWETQMPPYLLPKEGPYMGPSQNWQDSEKFSRKLPLQFSSVQFSPSVVSDSLRPHELQHARPPCPSPTPGVHSNSRL